MWRMNKSDADALLVFIEVNALKNTECPISRDITKSREDLFYVKNK